MEQKSIAESFAREPANFCFAIPYRRCLWFVTTTPPVKIDRIFEEKYKK